MNKDSRTGTSNNLLKFIEIPFQMRNQVSGGIYSTNTLLLLLPDSSFGKEFQQCGTAIEIIIDTKESISWLYKSRKVTTNTLNIRSSSKIRSNGSVVWS